MKKLIAILALSLAVAPIIPAAAMAQEAPADGSYSIEVELGGGSGKSTVESPAAIEIEGGEMTATIVWSSSNYDLMVVDGAEYQPVTLDGGSTFEIPVSALDEALPVSAETVAMSTPHMIDYTLTFDSSTIQAVSESDASGNAGAVADAETAANKNGASAINLPLIIGGAVLAVAVIAALVVILRRKGDR